MKIIVNDEGSIQLIREGQDDVHLPVGVSVTVDMGEGRTATVVARPGGYTLTSGAGSMTVAGAKTVFTSNYAQDIKNMVLEGDVVTTEHTDGTVIESDFISIEVNGDVEMVGHRVLL